MDDIERALATLKQRRLFFKLCSNAGYDIEECKERAKKKFGLSSFKDIQKHQLSQLIDLLSRLDTH